MPALLKVLHCICVLTENTALRREAGFEKAKRKAASGSAIEGTGHGHLIVESVLLKVDPASRLPVVVPRSRFSPAMLHVISSISYTSATCR